jgi:hypothetical protein
MIASLLGADLLIGRQGKDLVSIHNGFNDGGFE